MVRVVTEPDIGGGTFGFTGTPAGQLTLVPDQVRTLTANVTADSCVSKGCGFVGTVGACRTASR